MKTLQKDEKGFTIIEVLIVLAIAGLIMVIVFLAVPALQRNSRNTQRSNDVSRIAAAINECTNNKNGNLASCDSQAKIDPSYISFSDNQQITAMGGPTINSTALTKNTKCNPAGDGTQTGGGVRAFTLLYQVETSSGTATRCIQG